MTSLKRLIIIEIKYKCTMLFGRISQMKKQIFATVILIVLMIFVMSACNDNNKQNQVKPVEYDTITLTKDNFFDYFIPNTVSTKTSTSRDPELSSALIDRYRMDYSVKCKYSKAICVDVIISFKVGNATYKDIDGNYQNYMLTEKMYLTDDGKGDKTCNYDERYIPSIWQSTGGYVLSKSSIAEVSGTIKIPKE